MLVEKHRNKNNLANRIVSSKYTLLNFIPKNIFIQLSKASTFFFFITLILLCIPAVSPFEPYSYALAFSIVVGTSMIKDGIEDYNRHKEDNEANSRKVLRVKMQITENQKLEHDFTTVENVNCGDILFIKENEMVPADCLVIKSFDFVKNNNKEGNTCEFRIEPNNECYVETSNLDGETNLKKKYNLFGTHLNKECVVCGKDFEFDKKESLNDENCKNEDDFPLFVLHKCICIKSMYENITEYNIKDTGETFTEYHAKIFFNDLKDELKENKYNRVNRNNAQAVANDVIKSKYASIKNVLLRGSVVKNTSAVAVLSLSVGEETKMSRSLKKLPTGKSSFASKTDSVIYIILYIYLIMFLSTILYAMFNTSISTPLSNLDIVKSFFTNYILYTYLIPLSLFVTIEIARIFHVLYVAYDKDMTYTNNGPNSEGLINAKCRNSNVIEDLGLVDFILTDKTGTLTNNQMVLKKYLVKKDEEYINVDYHEYLDENKTKQFENNTMFILNMLVCNQVDVLCSSDSDDICAQNISYEGVSQEEISILNILKEHGIFIREKTQDFVVLQVKNMKTHVKVLDVLEFSSSRQRQSIIVEIKKQELSAIQKLIGTEDEYKGEDQSEKVTFLFTKGSDQKILRNFLNLFDCEHPLIHEFINKNSQGINTNKNENVIKSLTLKNTHKYKNIFESINKNTEYRALVYGFKVLNDYNNLLINILSGKSNNNHLDLNDKEKVYTSVFEILEFNVDFIGCTLIEDSLQEGVFETIKNIRDNGVKVWMITGDKKETAVTCAKNSGIAGNNYIAIVGRDIVNLLREELRLDNISNEIGSENTYNIFNFESIVIYRATPSQKGEICRCLNGLKFNTLAIGDGNNDVGMLKEANVGVGIQGKEGNQAALNSDFSVHKFKDLHKLLMQYGNNTIIRFSKLTINAFYKNLFFILIQYFYNYFNLGTGFPIYDNIFLNYFNTFYTALIPISIVLFDKEKEYKKLEYASNHEEQERGERPQQLSESVYNDYLKSRCHFTRKVIVYNLAYAFAQAIVCFGIFRVGFYKGISNSNGIQAGYGAESQLISLIVFFTVILRQVRIVAFYNIFTFLSVLISIAFAICVQFIFQSLPVITDTFFGPNSLVKLLKMPISYCIFALSMSTMYIMDVLFESLEHKLIIKEYIDLKRERKLVK
ncbi:Atp11c [Ecytonucleospora hepatopenaei]|uniref:Atp11c n=1 Tax=Ecytonucleospora hepatopenaei TaxID=646526 RepID=A0A1W0E4R9_9MICR|nr:Atp11c [Ecytonucleospora hepatopenaei]